MHAHVCINPEEIAFPCLTVRAYMVHIWYKYVVSSILVVLCMRVALQTYTYMNDLQ